MSEQANFQKNENDQSNWDLIAISKKESDEIVNKKKNL